MAEPAHPPQPTPARPPTLFGTLVALPFQVFGMLCGALLLAIIIECIGVHFLWPKEGWHHAQEMLDYELAQLSKGFRASALIQDPAAAARHWVAYAYDRLFVQSGLLELSRHHSPGAPRHATGLAGLRTLIHRTAAHLEVYALAAGYITLTFIVRVVVLALTLPLFALASFVALVDGLVQRDIRRFGAGHESAFVYHRARALMAPLALLPWGVYLSFPISIHPLWILLPSAVLLGAAVRITAATFKKYL